MATENVVRVEVVYARMEEQVIVWIVEGLPSPGRILQGKGGKDDLDLTVKSVR